MASRGMDFDAHFKTVQVDSVLEKDPLDTDLLDFRLTQETRRYRVTGEVIGNYDLLSYKQYHIEELWWVIAFLNGILNPFSDLETGQMLVIPVATDLWALVHGQL